MKLDEQRSTCRKEIVDALHKGNKSKNDTFQRLESQLIY